MKSNDYRRTTPLRKRRKLRNPRNAAALRPPNQRPRTKTKTRRRSHPPKRPSELLAARKPPRKKKKRDPTTPKKRMTNLRWKSQRNPLLKEAVLANLLLQRRRIPKRIASQLPESLESPLLLLLLLLLTKLSLKLKRRPSPLKKSRSVDVRSLPRSFLSFLPFSLLIYSICICIGDGECKVWNLLEASV